MTLTTMDTKPALVVIELVLHPGGRMGATGGGWLAARCRES